MRPHVIMIATVALALLLYASFGAGLWGLLGGARGPLWGVSGVESAVRIHEPEEIEALLARLEAQPVPGVAAPAEGGPALGALAEAAAACTLDSAGGAPPPAAREALRRYLLSFGAIAAEPDSPLLEPRFAALGPLFAHGPGEVLRSVSDGDLGDGERQLLADFHATYSQPRHPLYHDLGLHPGTFPELNFQSLADTLGERPEAVADCALAATLAGQAALPVGEVRWRCERLDERFAITSTVAPTNPPTLRLARADRAGEVEEAAAVETDRGSRFEGDGWAFRSAGAGAVLELPDGTTATCVREAGG